MDENGLKKDSVALLKDMESIAAQMRGLILKMPPFELLGYIYSQYIMKGIAGQGSEVGPNEAGTPGNIIDDNQFLLEYVHAVLASEVAPAEMLFDETQCADLFELARKLREQAMFYAIATSADTHDGLFGQNTGEIEFRAKSSWVMLRGNRYPVLEGEFYSYVLEPHDAILKEVYDVGAVDIAAGFQAIADAARYGHSVATEKINNDFMEIDKIITTQGKSQDEAMLMWFEGNQQRTEAAKLAIDDILLGGIANVSQHTNLPRDLLADLAYQRGEETEFFAPGDFSGTPYRTLPARKKPLIQLESDYYAIDLCFVRDAGYRALLYNILQHKPDYKKSFEDRQKAMSEAAFADILSAQLPNASVFQEVYYKDIVSNRWVENDTLILMDDVLFLIEAKAGAAATIASPALDFDRHAQSVQDLVLKAYKQCKRFFNYLSSAEDVPLYHFANGKYEECARVRHADYRVMVPIGLTVESFSPFSAYCKELPQVELLLGKHAFVSLSIDDLFVLRRLLPTPGEFAHYMEVRQAVAGMRRANIFDELDHLGAYLMKNRFDRDIARYLKDGVDMLIWDDMSDIVDESFEGEKWEDGVVPTQEFPVEVLRLLEALNATRSRGWLSAESCIRDFGKQGRKKLAEMLANNRKNLDQYPSRYFILSGGNSSIFVWLQQHGYKVDWVNINNRASAAVLFAKVNNAVGIVAEADADGIYHRAQVFTVHIPTERTDTNAHIYEEAAKLYLSTSLGYPGVLTPPTLHPKTKKTGRNEPCPCGSGRKYKKCHGR